MDFLTEMKESRSQSHAAIKRIRQIGFEAWKYYFEEAMMLAALEFDFDTNCMESKMTDQDLNFRRQQIIHKSQQDKLYIEFIREKSSRDFHLSRFRQMLRKN